MYHCFLHVLTKVVKFCTNLEDSKTGSGVDLLRLAVVFRWGWNNTCHQCTNSVPKLKDMWLMPKKLCQH